MLRSVSSELPWRPGGGGRANSRQVSSTWSRRQWPTGSRRSSSVSSADGSIAFLRARRCPAGTTTRNVSSKSGRTSMPGAS